MITRSSALCSALVLCLVAAVAPSVASAQTDPPPTCGGRTATIVGTPGDDVITGTPGVDIIHAGGGNDTVDALAGNDVVCGGTGDDRVDAGAGSDKVLGGDGNDHIIGGSGADNLRGQRGDDQLRGNGGDDTIGAGSGDDVAVGHKGDDHLTGDDGADTLRGGHGDDTIHGGRGEDTVNGSNGTDLLRGGAHNDAVRAGGGNDTLRGGAGSDTLEAGRGDDVVWSGPGHDYLDGGRGVDRCADATSLDEAVCEDTEPPPGTLGCLPEGQSSPYLGGVIGSAARAQAGSRGPAVFIGDSLAVGHPSDLASRLGRIGYGPVCVDSVSSRSIHRAPTGHTSGLDVVAHLKATHPIWSSDATWIVALGTNDSRFWTTLTSDVALDEVALAIDAIGASASDRWWFNIRTMQSRWHANEDAWNEGVEAHPRLGVIDWAAVATDRPEWFFDGVHPNSQGQLRRLRLLEAALTAST